MFRRAWWLLFPGLAFAGLYAGGCGSDTSLIPDDGGPDLDATVEGGSTDDSGNNGGDGPGGGDGAGGDTSTACGTTGAACKANSDCCSNLCNGNTLKCVTGAKCGAAGEPCAAPTDCCTLSCVNGACGTQCTSDNQPCTTDAQCCGGSCTAGDAGAKVCKPLNGSCKTSGNTCAANTDCCSGLCTGGLCAITSSFCVQTGDVCVKPTDCCGGVCTIASGAVVGTCGLLPAGASNCNGGVDGTLCGTCTDCCSRVCAPYITGVNICQPANGCHIDGDLCRKDSDCCGGEPDSGLPGAGNVTCEVQSGYAIGICRNPLSCNPEGNVCHYKGGTGYQCTSSSARNDCCDFLGSKSDCTLDALGVPRCHVIGNGDAGAPCRNPTETCAFTGDCCNGVPCVPGPNGLLVCYSGGGTCVPVNGPCTINADCCNGTQCVVPLGSTQGTCNPLVPPPPPPPDGGPPPPPPDSGKPCALFGQGCQTGADCCNNVQCTAGGGLTLCGAGQTGCTCVNLIPR